MIISPSAVFHSQTYLRYLHTNCLFLPFAIKAVLLGIVMKRVCFKGGHGILVANQFRLQLLRNNPGLKLFLGACKSVKPIDTEI